MTGEFDQRLLQLSVLIGVLSGCAALNLVQRVSLSRRVAARSWLTLGALLLGAGIWAMQFALLLAFELPIVVVYHVPTMLFALGLSMLMCFFALWVASAPHMGALRLAVGGTCMGLALVGMYYSAVFAMQVVPAVLHEPRGFAIASGIAIGAGWLTLGLAALLRHGSSLVMLLARVTSGIIVGAALWWHAWRSLASARFAPDSYSLGASVAEQEAGGNGWLMLIAAGCALGVLAVMLLTLIDHARRMPTGQRGRDDTDPRGRDSPGGLASGATFERRFDELQESAATRDEQHALLVLDAGDASAVAPELAARLAALVRPGDTVSRLDDGQFVLLIAKLADAALAGRIATRVHDEIARPFETPGGPVHLRPRIGIALYPRDGADLDALRRAAILAART